MVEEENGKVRGEVECPKGQGGRKRVMDGQRRSEESGKKRVGSRASGKLCNTVKTVGLSGAVE